MTKAVSNRVKSPLFFTPHLQKNLKENTFENKTKNSKQKKTERNRGIERETKKSNKS